MCISYCNRATAWRWVIYYGAVPVIAVAIGVAMAITWMTMPIIDGTPAV
jgi:anti-sigma-K factor RskA